MNARYIRRVACINSLHSTPNIFCRFISIRHWGGPKTFEVVEPPVKAPADQPVKQQPEELKEGGLVTWGTGRLPLKPKGQGPAQTAKKVKIKLRSPWDTTPLRQQRHGTSLHWAVDPWKDEEARKILDKGVLDINAQNSMGRTALHLLVTQDRPEEVQLLIDFGAGLEVVDDDGFTPLRLAVYHKNRRVVETLVEAGANLDAKDAKGETALLTATRRNSEPIARLLLDAGAQMCSETGAGTTLIHHAVRLRRKKILELFLSRSKLEVNTADPDGATPLHAAAEKDEYTAAYILLTNGANSNAQDANGNTPLHIAANKLHQKSVAVLRQMGADPSIMNHKGEIPDSEFIKKWQNKTMKTLPLLAEFAKVNPATKNMRRRQSYQLNKKMKMGAIKDWDTKIDQAKARRDKKRRAMVYIHLLEKVGPSLRPQGHENHWLGRGIQKSKPPRARPPS